MEGLYATAVVVIIILGIVVAVIFLLGLAFELLLTVVMWLYDLVDEARHREAHL